jgi:hypothetical protein
VREGYFYATLPLGSPAKAFGLIVDTGSTITYVPCHDCEHCGPNHYNEPYNPRCAARANRSSAQLSALPLLDPSVPFT